MKEKFYICVCFQIFYLQICIFNRFLSRARSSAKLHGISSELKNPQMFTNFFFFFLGKSFFSLGRDQKESAKWELVVRVLTH